MSDPSRSYSPFPPPSDPPDSSRQGRHAAVAMGVAAVLVVAAAILLPRFVSADDAGSGAADLRGDDVDAMSNPGPQPAPTGLDEVRAYGDLPTTHSDEPVTYDQSPPVGGAHFGSWMDCGAFSEPLRDEVAVHDLEHGAVWISYDPSLDDAAVAELVSVLPANGIMAPYTGLDSPVVVTVWERQLDLWGANDPGLEDFIDVYAGGVTAPQPFASCAGGLTDPGSVG